MAFKKVVFVDKSYGFEDEYIIKPSGDAYPGYLFERQKPWYWKLTINKFDFSSFLKANKNTVTAHIVQNKPSRKE